MNEDAQYWRLFYKIQEAMISEFGNTKSYMVEATKAAKLLVESQKQYNSNKPTYEYKLLPGLSRSLPRRTSSASLLCGTNDSICNKASGSIPVKWFTVILDSHVVTQTITSWVNRQFLSKVYNSLE